MRLWTARQGHENALRQELVRANEAHRTRNPAMTEWLIYRERLGRDFFGMVVYDDEAALKIPERMSLLEELDSITETHAEGGTPSLRVELIQEFTTIPPSGSHGMIGLFQCRAEETGDL